MSIHYPAGTKARSRELLKEEKPKEKAKKESPLKGKHLLSAANRGQSFEDDINSTNLYYREKGLALVQKRPTPIKIVHVDYSKGAKITEAYFETQSTTDYNGIYKGHYLDFEAKSTRGKTSFPLGNIAPQQVDHLERVLSQGGIAFFLIELTKSEEVYLLDASYICRFYREAPRHSIPFDAIREHGVPVKQGFNPRLDYLKAVDLLYFDTRK